MAIGTVYLHNIIILSRIKTNIYRMFVKSSYLQNSWRPVNLKKRHFFFRKIGYLGHVIRPGKLELTDHTTDANYNLKLPCNKTKLKLLLGFCKLYGHFVHCFTGKAAESTRSSKVGESRTLDSFSLKRPTFQ